MILAYTGVPGSGKTAGMVRDAVMNYRQSVLKKAPLTIYTNMCSLLIPGMVFLNGYEDLQRINKGIVLIDEVGVYMPSRLWASVPREVLSALVQSRHNSLDLYYTAQFFEQVDKILREITSVEVRCLFPLKLLHIQHYKYPQLKVGIEWKVWLPSHNIYGMYQTTEIIVTPAGKSTAADSRRVLKAAERRLHEVEAYSERLLQSYAPNSTSTRIELTLPEQMAATWLQALGLYEPRSKGFASLLKHHARRAAWLHLFGLTLYDVPVWCTPNTPFSIPPPAQFHPQSQQLSQPSLADLTLDEQDDMVDDFYKPRDWGFIAEQLRQRVKFRDLLQDQADSDNEPVQEVDSLAQLHDFRRKLGRDMKYA